MPAILRKKVDISKNLIKTSARTLPLPLSSTAMAEILTGQQRHHLWFLKVAIALASVGDGSNLPRPYILETKPRMAPELWICAKLEIASSNVTSSGGETRLMWKSAGDDEPGPIVAALASLQVLQGCRSRGRVWTGTTKLSRQGLRPRNNLVLDFRAL